MTMLCRTQVFEVFITDLVLFESSLTLSWILDHLNLRTLRLVHFNQRHQITQGAANQRVGLPAKMEYNVANAENGDVPRFFISGRFSDFEIRLPKFTFRVHKVVICSKSKYFETLCGEDFLVRTSR